MKIYRVLNNNAVVIINNHGKEKIVCGKGIAFNKKSGDMIDVDQINKVFVLSNNEMNDKFQQLVTNIPIEYIQLADEIIEYAKLNLGKKLNENLIISLSDHLYTSICRHHEGMPLKNGLLWDIKRFYNDEFQIGMKILDMVEERFNIRLIDDEAGFLAIHFVNAQMDEDYHNMYEITKIMQEVSNIVKYFFNISFDENSVYYYRFITHLKFFAQRILYQKQYDSQEDGLLELIKMKYANSYQCVERVSHYIWTKYEYQLSNEEKAYLTIHIERLIYKHQQD